MSHISISPASAHQALDVQLVSPDKRVEEPSRNTFSVNESAFLYYCKRMLDVSMVLLSLPLLTPILLIAALFIRLDSSGPIFFCQERVGSKRTVENGKVVWKIQNFKIFKFRSMYVNSDESIHQEHVRAWINGELDVDADSNAKTKVVNDPRITKIGHFLRKTSLDEAPQIINILLGQMSIVGPRPVPEYEVAQYQPEHYERLNVLPGLTGLWQVEGRGNVSFEEMMELDIKYVRSRSVWQDLKIIFLTVPAVLSGRGAK